MEGEKNMENPLGYGILNFPHFAYLLRLPTLPPPTLHRLYIYLWVASSEILWEGVSSVGCVGGG